MMDYPVFDLSPDDKLRCQANLYERDTEIGVRPVTAPVIRCTSKATISVGDAVFCRRHAALLVLNLALTATKDKQGGRHG